MKLRSFYTIRFNDCDPFNHLNNSRYLDYMLNAREDHLRLSYGLNLSEFMQNGFGWVVTSHHIKYLRPAIYNEKVAIQTALLEVTTEYLVVEMLMMNEAGTHLKALLWTKFFGVNAKSGKKENHSAEFMEFAKSILDKDIDYSHGFAERIRILGSTMQPVDIVHAQAISHTKGDKPII